MNEAIGMNLLESAEDLINDGFDFVLWNGGWVGSWWSREVEIKDVAFCIFEDHVEDIVLLYYFIEFDDAFMFDFHEGSKFA